MSSKNSEYYFLQRGGEMGELIRAKDWSKTSLGDPSDWPQSLRTMVAVMLDNPFGMYIAWGDEYIQLYNDGYRPILGATKHPQALGISTKETFSEIWDNIIGSMFDGVMQGHAVGFPDFMLPLNRNGFVEECYFDFSYSPIRKDDGEVGGVLVTVIETTNRKKADEALKESEARFRAIADEAPVFIFLAGENAAVDYLNKTWRDYTGISTEDSTGRAWANITHPEDVDPATKIYMDGFNKRESCSFENRQKGTDGIYRTILWKATPRFSANGQFIGMMGVGFDINDRKKSEEKLRESNQRFRNTMKQAPVGITILRGPEYIVEMANDAYLQLVDKKEADFVGKPIFTSLPEVEEAVHVLLDNVLNTGIPYHGNEVAMPINRYGKQDILYFDFLYHPLKEEDGKISGVIAIVTEVTEKVESRHIIEERKRLYETVTQNTPDLIYVFDLNYRFTYANEALLKMWGLSWDDAIGKSMLENGYELWHAEMHEREIDQVIATKKPVRGEVSFPHAKLGKRMYDYIFAPVINEKGEVESVAGTTRDISDIKNAEVELKKSEEQFRLLANSMPQHIWTSDPEGNLNYYNQSVFDYSGLTLEQINKDGWLQIVHPDDREENIKQWSNSITTGNDFIFEHRFRRHDGEYRWQLCRAIPQRDDTGKIQMWVGTSTDIQDQKTFAKELEEQVITRTAELKASEQKFYNLFNLSPISKTLSEIETGKIVMINDAFTKLFEHSREETIDKTSAELTLLDLQTREFMINELKSHGKFTNKELIFFKKSGEKFIALASAEIINIGDKRYIFSAFHDISEIKNAEEHIKQKNIEIENKTIQLEEAQQLAHIGSWEWDVVANKIEWSDELFRLFGLTPQEVESDYENYLKHIHSDDRDYANSIVQQALKDHQPFSFFHKVTDTDGKVRILSATGKVITDDMGNVIRMSGTAQDVTVQKNYEDELKISEERFYKIFDSNPVPMSLSDIGNNKIKYANNLFFKVFGYNKQEVIGHTSEDLNLLDPEETKRVVNVIFGYLLENRSLDEVQALSKEEKEELLLKLNQSEKMKDFEILYTRKNGEKFPALVSYEVIRIGLDSYTVTSYRDITEIKKTEEQLRSQNYQLEKMNNELQSFAYISSHDLQEPLRKIQTFATRISEKEETNLSESGKYMFNRMQEAAKRMQTLIQDLLAYSRTNATDPMFETTDLNVIIAEVKEDLKEELNERHAIIEAIQLCNADIIPFQFRQLMHNLIGNSLKYSNPKIPPFIQVKSEIAKGQKLENEKLSPHKKYCHISVSDNGIGFEQKYSEKIFEVFQRVHGKDKFSGTGIGLSIVKKIVENHNGIITAYGEPNKGATFDIYIPAS